MVATGYDSPYGSFSRPLQFLRQHLWSPSSANVCCPVAMQDGAASLLKRHLTSPRLASQLSQVQHRVFEDAFGRLTSRDPALAWTSGQWMTERPGGSDVTRTETVAVRTPGDDDVAMASQSQQLPLGPWSISGFKWFSSATDAQMTILLAQTSSGLSAFFAPLRRHQPSASTKSGLPHPGGESFNGVRISRLKSKLGTQSLPTAELVLDQMRAWMIGCEGSGVHEISTVLTLTRIHSAAGAVAHLGRGLAIARAYALVREIGTGHGRRAPLSENFLHMRTLARMTTHYRGLMLLTLFNAHILGLSEHPSTEGPGPEPALAALTPRAESVQALLRVLPQLTKAYVSYASLPLLFSCMESLGGVGYLLNEEQAYLNIARLYRDACAGPIWEGTTDVLCSDFVRSLKRPGSGPGTLAALKEVIQAASSFQGRVARPDAWLPVDDWVALESRVEATSRAELDGEARELVWTTADLLVSTLLYVDAARDGDSVALDMFQRFLDDRFGFSAGIKGSREDKMRKDRAIVFGSTGFHHASKL